MHEHACVCLWAFVLACRRHSSADAPCAPQWMFIFEINQWVIEQPPTGSVSPVGRTGHVGDVALTPGGFKFFVFGGERCVPQCPLCAHHCARHLGLVSGSTSGCTNEMWVANFTSQYALRWSQIQSWVRFPPLWSPI